MQCRQWYMCCINNSPHFKAEPPHSYHNRGHQPNWMTPWEQGLMAWYTHHFTAVQHSNREQPAANQNEAAVWTLSQSFCNDSGMLISVSSLLFPCFNRDLNAIYFFDYLIYLSTYHFSITAIINYYLISKYSQPSNSCAFVITIELSFKLYNTTLLNLNLRNPNC